MPWPAVTLPQEISTEAVELLAQADDIMPAAAHLVFDSDRIDADWPDLSSSMLKAWTR